VTTPLPHLRIAQVAPPHEAVPPPRYGGTERVIYELVEELHRRGHEVTLFASGESTTSARLVPTVDTALRPAGRLDEQVHAVVATIGMVYRRSVEFDVIHAHLDWAGVLLARLSHTPVIATFHGRLDRPWASEVLADPPPGLTALSTAHASAQPDIPFIVVPNGLNLTEAPFMPELGDELCFVGRMSPDKGVVEAIEIARSVGRRLRIAAKVPANQRESDYFENEVRPAARRAEVEFVGELSPEDRDQLYATSFATLMPGDWPEPFGLVAIESMACGTPVVARWAGALPEIVRDGVGGIVDSDVTRLAERLGEVASLDRAAIRASVLERFSSQRMADGYEAAYRRLIAGAGEGVAMRR